MGYSRGTVVSHDSYLINLCADDPTLRQRSREALLQEMLRCTELGVDFVVMHPGAHKGQGRKQGLDSVVRSVVDVLQNVGDEAPTLLFENTAGQGSYLGGDFADLGYLVERVEGSVGRRFDGEARVGICFDTCHAFVAGYDVRGERGMAQVLDELRSFVPLEYLRVFHLNDTHENLGSRRDRHCRLGEGRIGWETFVMLHLDERWSHCPGILETPTKGLEDAYRVQLRELRHRCNLPLEC